MPTRNAQLFRRLNDTPATVLRSGGITTVRAALRKQITFHLREEWRIRTDNGESGVVLVRGDDTALLWIEAEPLQKRAPGGGRKTIAEDEPTKVTTVRLPQSHYDWLADRGNVADTIRALVQQAIEQHH